MLRCHDGVLLNASIYLPNPTRTPTYLYGIPFFCVIDNDDGQSLLINMAATPSVSEADSATKKNDKSKGCILEARHAIAKTLVTTNPHLLTEAQTMG